MRRATSSLVALALLASIQVLGSAPARAAVTFEVEVGRFFNDADHTAESMRFYPSVVKVVPGDTLHFTTGSFHGVTLLPLGVEPAVWAGDAAGSGGSWSPFESDPDEGANAARINLKVAFPSSACGWPGQGPCDFDGAGDPALDVLNSGLPLFPESAGEAETRKLSFEVTVNADPGTVLYAVDPLHPNMNMKIEVVEGFSQRSDPSTLETESNLQFETDRSRATKLHQTYSKKKVSKKVKGKTVWQAWAGVEEEGISLRRMYPKKLTIKRGQKVRWNLNLNRYEAHALVFPTSQAVAASNGFPQVVCDEAGDDDVSPDSSPSSVNFPFCGSFSALELDVPSLFTAKTGDGVVKSARDKEASSARGASYAANAVAYQLSFPKKSSKKGFPYACAIHEAAHAPMRASVVVQ